MKCGAVVLPRTGYLQQQAIRNNTLYAIPALKLKTTPIRLWKPTSVTGKRDTGRERCMQEPPEKCKAESGRVWQAKVGVGKLEERCEQSNKESVNQTQTLL